MVLRRREALGIVLAALLAATPAHGQISLISAVALAERNDTRVTMAQAEVNKASAALTESHDAFIPSLTAGGGVGKSTGVPLSLPVVFSVSANSLVLNASQRDNVRAARAGLQTAVQNLTETRDSVAEDTVNTYLALDEATRRRDALRQAGRFANRLTQITRDRVEAGQDAKVEELKALHTAWQLRLQLTHAEDDIQTLSDHLSRLCGLGTSMPQAVHDSIPAIAPLLPSEKITDEDPVFDTDGAAQPPESAPNNMPDSPSVRSAFANANAKQYTAAAQRRYLFFPQLAFAANYSRVSTAFTNYDVYYRGFTQPNLSYNALAFGVQITMPLFDRAQKARAQQAQADAEHDLAQANNARNLYQEGRLKLLHGQDELYAKKVIASLDQQLAQKQLDAVLVQLEPGAGALQGPQLNPKDEQNARLNERERFIDMLATQLDYDQTSIRLMHQTGALHNWLLGAMRGNGTPVPVVTIR